MTLTSSLKMSLAGIILAVAAPSFAGAANPSAPTIDPIIVIPCHPDSYQYTIGACNPITGNGSAIGPGPDSPVKNEKINPHCNPDSRDYNPRKCPARER